MLAEVRKHVVAMAVIAVAMFGLAVAPAGAATNKYPDAVVKQFVKSCTKSAVAAADGEVTTAQARTYCRSAIACIQRKLTLKQFTQYVKRMQSGEANPGAKAVNRCIKQAARAATA